MSVQTRMFFQTHNLGASRETPMIQKGLTVGETGSPKELQRIRGMGVKLTSKSILII